MRYRICTAKLPSALVLAACVRCSVPCCPGAVPGILAGIILAVGRIVGETAALMYTAGTVAEIAMGKDFLFDSTRTLAVHMYLLSSEGFHTNEAYATAVVLLAIVLAINTLSSFVAKRLTKN